MRDIGRKFMFSMLFNLNRIESKLSPPEKVDMAAITSEIPPRTSFARRYFSVITEFIVFISQKSIHIIMKVPTSCFYDEKKNLFSA